ncbi:type 1 fimbrial protein [Cronobacter malonaticus]|jgi:type 1 fimbria pilin|nr:type 1 fimbrial protein [Cronobacter malonaticus]
MMTRRTAQKGKLHRIGGLMLAAAVLSSGPVQADSEVKFHGTLMAASCTPDAMNVEFGEVSLDKVSVAKSSAPLTGSIRATGAAMQQFALNFSCSGNINEIKYKWSGTTSSFNNQLLATDMQGLAIEIGDADTASVLPPDQWYSLTKDVRSKKLLAILQRDSNSTFVGGEFNATATFTIQVP